MGLNADDAVARTRPRPATGRERVPRLAPPPAAFIVSRPQNPGYRG